MMTWEEWAAANRGNVFAECVLASAGVWLPSPPEPPEPIERQIPPDKPYGAAS